MRSSVYKIVLIFLMMGCLFGFDDLDFDGVSDQEDQCPQSLFSDLVDKYGCKVSSVLLKESHNFDIHTEISNAKGDDYNYISNSIGLAYFYRNMALYFSSSYYQYELLDYDASSEGQGDYTLSFKYKYKLNNNINLNMKSGANIPSSNEDNKKTDIFVSLSSGYQIVNKLSVSGEFTYTFMNDVDSKGVKYNNYYSFDVASKYKITSNISSSLSYSQSSSSVEDEEDTKALYLSTSYFFDNGVYSLINIGQELNDNPSISHSFKIGYFF